MVRVFGGVVLALVLAAGTAVAAPDTQPVKALKAMAEADVRAVLSDVEIGPECCDAAEEFYSDGGYVLLGYVGMTGTYTVAGNRVCTTRNQDHFKKCRRVYADAKDVAYMADEGDRDAYLLEPRPIKPAHLAKHAERKARRPKG